MLPHEENWVAERSAIVGPGFRADFDNSFHGRSDPQDQARARLAAQAPAMARLLVAYLNDPSDGRVVTDFRRDFWRHAQGVLRDAGVIP